MPSPRSPFLRPTLAVGAALLHCALGYIAFGLAVRSYPGRLKPVLGSDRYWRLFHAYERVAAALGSGDRDGDGICDGREFFLRSDPRDPGDHLSLIIDTDCDDIFAFLWETSDEGGYRVRSRGGLWMEAGERAQARARVNTPEWSRSTSVPVDMPRGFRVRLTPSAHVLVGPPGGSLTNTDLVLPVGADGLFVFDAQMPAQEDNSKPATWHELSAYNAATGEKVGGIDVHRVWRLPALDPAIEPISSNGWHEEPNEFLEGRKEFYRLKWPSVPTAEHLLIEAARDQADATWYHITFLHDPAKTSCIIQRLCSGPSKPYTGPLKFRVVPLRYSPP